MTGRKYRSKGLSSAVGLLVILWVAAGVVKPQFDSFSHAASDTQLPIELPAEPDSAEPLAVEQAGPPDQVADGECLSGVCANFFFNYPLGTHSVACGAWATVANDTYGGDYAFYSVVAGRTYEWSFCPEDGGSASYDSQLTLWNSNGTTRLCYSDDWCGDDAKIRWTAPSTQTVVVLVSQYDCLSNFTNSTLKWRCESTATPPDIRVEPNSLAPFHCPNLATAAAEFVESQAEVHLEGISYEEYLDRQEKLNKWLISELPQTAFESSVVVELDQDEIRTLENPARVVPLQIGLVKSIRPNVKVTGLDLTPDEAQGPRDNGGVVSVTPDGGLVWSLKITSPDAGAIRVHLEDVSLPPNGELYFYSVAGEAFGPYTGTGPNATGEFWTESVFGSEGILQFRVRGPVDEAALRMISLTVTEVGHIGRRFTDEIAPVAGGSFCQNASCIVDASCYAGANATKDAIAKMEWVQTPFIYTCTTGLVADTDVSTVRHYCLTANHCINSNSTAQSIQFYWRFRTATCNGTCPSNTGWPFKTSGATLRATGTSGDFTLLEANTAPPAGSVYMGFTNVPVANTNGAALHRVSNPIFGPQVYSEHTVDTSAGTCQGLPRGQMIYSRDTLGGTDGGSSGSPLVNASNQVVGQLTGACGPNPDVVCLSANATIDGALAHYWTSVQPFLDPDVVSCPTGQVLTIHNDGQSSLGVSSVSKPTWAQLNPPPPYQISGGQSKQVCVTVNCAACAGADLDGNLTISSNDPDETPLVAVHVDCPTILGPAVLKWESVLTHSPNLPVPVALEIPDTGMFSEPRTGVEKIVVTFDGAIDPATAIPANVTVCGSDINNSPLDLSGIVITTATTTSDTKLEINFMPELPNIARHRIVLSTNIQGAGGGAIQAGAGGLSRILSALWGDVTGDLRVNATDLGFVRGLIPTNPINPGVVDQVRADPNNTGNINASDLGLVRARVGQDARGIADPICP